MRNFLIILVVVIVVFAIAAAIMVTLGILIGATLHFVIPAIEMQFATLIGVVTVGFLGLLTVQIVSAINEVNMEQMSDSRSMNIKTTRQATRSTTQRRSYKPLKPREEEDDEDEEMDDDTTSTDEEDFDFDERRLNELRNDPAFGGRRRRRK